MSFCAVVTGGGTGIGAAVVAELAASGARVFAVGRRLAPLQAVAAAAPDKLVTPVTADVTLPEGRAAVVAAVRDAGVPCRFLVHNAAQLGPMKPLMELTEAEWGATAAVNVEAPLFLTQALLPLLERGRARILHVSSGAAHGAVAHWGAYCTTKAALHMLYQVLKLELEGVCVVGSARPGVVDTDMHAVLRQSAPFPAQQRFLDMKARREELLQEEGELGGGGPHPPPAAALDSPRNVGAFLRWLLLDTADAEFSAAEWDIRDPHHHPRWCVGDGGAASR
jgi:benzil reductase ((S)-benzoin forming)